MWSHAYEVEITRIFCSLRLFLRPTPDRNEKSLKSLRLRRELLRFRDRANVVHVHASGINPVVVKICISKLRGAQE